MNPRLFLLILLAAACLFAAWAHGAPTPVKQATQLRSHTASVIVSTNPPAVAGLWLTWQPPTNACYVVRSSTDLVTWSACTNVPVTQTNVFIPVTSSPEFFKAWTALPVTSGGFWISDLSTYTNSLSGN